MKNKIKKSIIVLFMLTLVFSVTFNYAQAKELTKSETIAIIEIFKSLGILTSEQVQILMAVLNLNLNNDDNIKQQDFIILNSDELPPKFKHSFGGKDYTWRGIPRYETFEIDNEYSVSAQPGIIFVSFSKTVDGKFEEVTQIIEEHGGIIVGQLQSGITLQVFVNNRENFIKLFKILEKTEFVSVWLNVESTTNNLLY